MKKNNELALMTVNAKISSSYNVEMIYLIYKKSLMNY